MEYQDKDDHEESVLQSHPVKGRIFLYGLVSIALLIVIIGFFLYK